MCKPPNDHHFEVMEVGALCDCGAFALAWTLEATGKVEPDADGVEWSQFRLGKGGLCVGCRQPLDAHDAGVCPTVNV